MNPFGEIHGPYQISFIKRPLIIISTEHKNTYVHTRALATIKPCIVISYPNYTSRRIRKNSTLSPTNASKKSTVHFLCFFLLFLTTIIIEK